MKIKHLRIMIGVLMMYSFLSLGFGMALTISLVATAGITGVLGSWIFLLPPVSFIWLSYHVLTKVYPYKGGWIGEKLSAEEKIFVWGGEERLKK